MLCYTPHRPRCLRRPRIGLLAVSCIVLANRDDVDPGQPPLRVRSIVAERRVHFFAHPIASVTRFPLPTRPIVQILVLAGLSVDTVTPISLLQVSSSLSEPDWSLTEDTAAESQSRLLQRIRRPYSASASCLVYLSRPTVVTSPRICRHLGPLLAAAPPAQVAEQSAPSAPPPSRTPVVLALYLPVLLTARSYPSRRCE